MAEQKSIDELVLVVHGVGDPEPGETLSLFARSVADQKQPLTETQEVLWLEEPGKDDRNLNTFCSHVRHLSFTGGDVTFAEVFWGDLSQVKKGTIGAIVGLIEIVFGLRFLAYVAANQTSKASRWLQWLGMLVSRIVHGPLLAVNAVLMSMAIGAAVSELLWAGSTKDNAWGHWLIAGCVGLCLLSTYLACLLTNNHVVRRFWFWIAVCAMFLSALLLLEILGVIKPPVYAQSVAQSVAETSAESTTSSTAVSTSDKVEIKKTDSHSKLSPQQHLLLHLAGSYTPGPFSFVDTKKIESEDPNGQRVVPHLHVVSIAEGNYCNLYCKTFVTFLGLMWLSLVIILIAMFGCWFLTLFDRRIVRRAIDTALLLPAISIGVWGVILPFLWIVLSQIIGKAIEIQEFNLLNDRAIFAEAIPLLGVQVLVAIAIFSVMAMVLAKYTWWRDRYGVDDYEKGKRAPRLIVNGWVQSATMLGAVLGIVLVLFMAGMEIQGVPYQSHSLGQILASVNKYAVAVMVPLSMIFIISFKHMRSALDIVGDVVTHFHFRRSLEEEEDDDFQFGEMTFRNATLEYGKRNEILRRMYIMLEHFRYSIDGKPKLTIVSHSQGTMFAIEVLNDSDMEWINDKFSEVNLLTMGSPLTHIYQYYFRHLYPPLNELYWSNLRSRVDKWVNIFRVDDFVGTEIEFETIADDRLEFSNHAVPKKGHNYYWCDRRVLEIIREHNICQALHSKFICQELETKSNAACDPNDPQCEEQSITQSIRFDSQRKTA